MRQFFFTNMKTLVRKILVASCVLLALSLALKGQQYNRIHADFSVKVKTAGGGQALTVGQVFYDKNIRQLIYYVSFPEKEIWITSDTVVYQIRDGKLVSRTATFSLAEFSVFHLALNSRLQDYGLRNTRYTVADVSRDKDLVITTWSPPEKAAKQLGNILVSAKNKQLFGVVFMAPEGSVLRKQFFEDYHVTQGLSFPGRIVEINSNAGKEDYQVTTYKNIVVDELENDSKYYYNVSGLRL
jgi:hypothetical protein